MAGKWPTLYRKVSKTQKKQHIEGVWFIMGNGSKNADGNEFTIKPTIFDKFKKMVSFEGLILIFIYQTKQRNNYNGNESNSLKLIPLNETSH